jgi:murein DD-endopeptidase MepM/ murein hydrolase activator NlpD
MNITSIVKHTLISLITLFGMAVFSVSAKETVIAGGNYSLRFVYNETVNPGDPVFVRMTFTRTGTQASLRASATTARLAFDANNAADFYPVPGKSADTASSADFLTAIPLSTWQKTGEASLSVTYAPFGTGSAKATLPFTIVSRHFNSETLKLSSENTATLTDTSPERAAQSEKLNKIVLTRNRTHVYQLTPFAKPLTSTRMTSHFGDRRVYEYSTGRTNTDVHWGNDYGVPTGTRVGACADGRVVLAELRNLTGWSVMIEHLPGLYSHYYHMDSLTVKEGDMVKQGDQIGYSGSTGFATGPHLHWDMRLNAVAVNPDFFTTDFAFLGE